MKIPLGTEVGLDPSDIVLDGDRAPKKGAQPPPQFLAHVCGQTAGWMKTPLGTEVDLRPGHIALDGVPTLRETGTAAPHVFGRCLLLPRSPISATAEIFFKKYCVVASLSQYISFCVTTHYFSKDIMLCAMSATQYF